MIERFSFFLELFSALKIDDKILNEWMNDITLFIVCVDWEYEWDYCTC